MLQNLNATKNTVSQASLESLPCFVNKHGQEPPTLIERSNLTDIINDQRINHLPVVGKQENVSLTRNQQLPIKLF